MSLPANATPARFAGAGALGQINTDWLTIAATCTPASWSDAAPHLAQSHTLADVLVAIATSTGEATDAILHTLLSAHHNGDTVAGRVLLQTMLGSVRRLMHTARYRRLDDPASSALEAMWHSIASYPLRRRRSVAANLALGALKHLHSCAEHELPAGDLLDVHIHREQVSGRIAPTPPDPKDEVTRLLAWALDSGTLTSDEVSLLARTYLTDTDPAGAQTSPAAIRERQRRVEEALADEHGITRSAIRHRRRNLVAKLAAAVNSHIDTLPF